MDVRMHGVHASVICKALSGITEIVCPATVKIGSCPTNRKLLRFLETNLVCNAQRLQTWHLVTSQPVSTQLAL